MNEEKTTVELLEPEAETPAAPEEAQPQKKGNKGRKSGRKKGRIIGRIIIILLILVILAAAAYIFIFRKMNKTGTTITLVEAAVTSGTISNSISGSGQVQPVEEYTVIPSVSGSILSDNITEGQKIDKGFLLYAIDPTNAQNTIKQNENALARAQLTYNQSAQTLNDLTVKSDISGVVTKVYVQNGQQVNANQSIMDVVDSSNLVLTLPFNAADTVNMYKGESAQITLDATGTILSGTVTSIYSGKQISSSGAIVTNVDITFSNPGVVMSGATGTAVVGGQYACNAAGTIAYVASKTVIAKASGQVSNLTLRAGDSVSSGQVIANLINDSAVQTAQNNELQVENAQLALQNAQNALTNYNITSPISGTVIEKNAKAGDTISSAGSSNTMAVIADMSSLVMTINVDELDILKVSVGQSATITADALPNQTFTGNVTNVSSIGNGSSSSSSTSSTGVTTYSVQITISEYGKLLPGMNVNAAIITQSAENAVLIPQQAIVSGGYVIKRVAASASSKPTATAAPASPSVSGSGNRTRNLTKLPAGYEYVPVTIGLTNSNYAQVLSGLNPGDVIAYLITPTVASTSSNSSSSSRTTVAIPGIGGGGAAGGIPGGGSYSGYTGGNNTNRTGSSSSGSSTRTNSSSSNTRG